MTGRTLGNICRSSCYASLAQSKFNLAPRILSFPSPSLSRSRRREGEDPGNEFAANFASGRMTNHRSVVKRKKFCLDIVSRRVINNYSSSPNGL